MRPKILQLFRTFRRFNAQTHSDEMDMAMYGVFQIPAYVELFKNPYDTTEVIDKNFGYFYKQVVKRLPKHSNVAFDSIYDNANKALMTRDVVGIYNYFHFDLANSMVKKYVERDYKIFWKFLRNIEEPEIVDYYMPRATDNIGGELVAFPERAYLVRLHFSALYSVRTPNGILVQGSDFEEMEHKVYLIYSASEVTKFPNKIVYKFGKS